MKFLKAWKGIISTAIVLLVFCGLPSVFRFFRPTSGTIDWGYLQGLVFSTIVFFSAILCAWIAIQCDWSIFTDYISRKKASDDWRYLTPFQRTVVMHSVILILILFYILCFFALPKP